jgi:hypothetical protein
LKHPCHLPRTRDRLYVGYDDRYKEGSAINPAVFSDPIYQRTNRAIHETQYLFRNGGPASRS